MNLKRLKKLNLFKGGNFFFIKAIIKYLYFCPIYKKKINMALMKKKLPPLYKLRFFSLFKSINYFFKFFTIYQAYTLYVRLSFIK